LRVGRRGAEHRPDVAKDLGGGVSE
jgi:hypothetical protein